MKLDQNYGSRSLFNMLTSGLLQKPNDLKLNSKNQTWKVPYIMQYIGPQVPNFNPWAKILHILGFSHWLPCWNFKVPFFYFFFAGRQNIYKFTLPYDCLIYHKVWLRSNQNRSSVLKFPIHVVLCEQKFRSAINFVIFVRWPKEITAYIPFWRDNSLYSLLKILTS